jgi:tungstate transport system ATP-binding protein
MSALLEISGLTVRAGQTVLVEIERLTLERGRGYLLSGENGAGKTTLLRALAGLETAGAQRCAFDGAAFVLAPYPTALRRRIAFVHQHPYVFDGVVRDNLAYGLRACGANRAQIAARVAEAGAWAGIAHLEERNAKLLSAGEKQRLALARAHLLDPDLYLLDEPTANLDEEGRHIVISLIEALGREGKTLLIACHDRELLSLPAVERLHIARGRLNGER